MTFHSFIDGISSYEGKHFIMVLVSRTERYSEKRENIIRDIESLMGMLEVIDKYEIQASQKNYKE